MIIKLLSRIYFVLDRVRANSERMLYIMTCIKFIVAALALKSWEGVIPIIITTRFIAV